VYFILFLIIIIIAVGAGNLAINKLNHIESTITQQDKQLLYQIINLLSEVYYITGWFEFEILIQLLQSIRDGYYPKSGILKPFETWMILARKHYSNYSSYKKIQFDRLEWIEEEEHVYDIINKIKNLSSNLQSLELLPCQFHIWLCCLLFKI
jgi:hypothetical protein